MHPSTFDLCRFLFDSSSGIETLPYDLAAVRHLGTAVTSFLVKGATRALSLDNQSKDGMKFDRPDRSYASKKSERIAGKGEGR